MSLSFFEENNTMIQRGIEKNCQTCNKQFGVFRKEHQCKRCFRAICSDCGKDRIMIYKHDFARYPHRRCTKCGQEVKQVIEYINSNHLSFGKMSNIGTKWIKKVQKRTSNVLIDDRKHKKFTREVFDRMWNSYNYTVRQFIGILTFQIDQEDVYKAVYDVLANVISVCPQQEIEGMAYLIIFLLCFCSADKVPMICFYLIELRNTVIDAQGLNQAYFRSLLISEDMLFKTKDFIGSKYKKYFSSFSINEISIKSSIYIIDKIITRKKIDQLYMFFCLSIDIVKEIIIQNKNTGVHIIDLAMVRNCSVEATSNKYKQVNAVKSMIFIKEKREDDDANSSILSSIEPNFYKQIKKSSLLTNSFTQGINQNAKETVTFQQIKYEEQMKIKSARPFRKKITEREDQFPEDSFSMYSMIQQQRDLPKSEATETQLLDLLYQAQQKSPNTSIDIKFQKVNHSKGYLLNEDTNQSNHQRQDNNGKLKPSQGQFQSQFQSDKTDELASLDREDLKRANKTIQQLKKQNRQLRQSLSQKENEKGKQNWKEQKSQNEIQIKKLKQTVMQYQNKQRQFQLSSMKIQQLKKTIKKQQIDVKSLQQQTEEANLTIKMLKNKLQNQSLSSQPIRQISQGQQSAKMMQMMKQSVRQKNQQIQDLTKKNKLLIYQMQQQNKNKLQDPQIIELTKKLKKEEKQKAEIIQKMKELSVLLMQEEDEKLNLSQENFALKEFIKSKGISLQNFKY